MEQRCDVHALPGARDYTVAPIVCVGINVGAQRPAAIECASGVCLPRPHRRLAQFE